MSIARELGALFLLLKERRWYEMGADEINFVLDQEGRVSKIHAAEIFEVDELQLNLLLLLKYIKDERSFDKVMRDTKYRKNRALRKFRKKAVMLRTGGEDALAMHNELCEFFGKTDDIL